MAKELFPNQLAKAQEALILLFNLPLSGGGGGNSVIEASAPESALTEGTVGIEI